MESAFERPLSISWTTMRISLLVLLLLFLPLPGPSLAQRKQESQPRPYAFTHVTIIDATGAPAQPDMTLVVMGTHLGALGKYGKVHIPSNAQVIDATGKFLIPGLWDMHAHTTDDWFLPLYLANGITGVRDMGNDSEAEMQLRRKWADSPTISPRLVSAGPIVDGPHPVWSFSIAVANAEEGRKAVTTVKRDFDFVKVYSLLPREAYFAIAEEAKKQQIPFAGHVPMSVSALEASDAGQKSIEHLDGVLLACSSEEAALMKRAADALNQPDPRISALPVRRALAKRAVETYDELKAQKLFARFVRNGTWQVPTLTVLRAFAYLDDPDLTKDPRLKYMPESLRQEWNPENDFRLKGRTAEDWANTKKVYRKLLEIVGAMNRAGVPLLAGTDTPNPYCFPGFSLHDELALLVQAGLTPMEALQTATRNPARFLGREKELGTIQTGKLADLVLLDANPLEDISNTRRVNAVMIGGKLLGGEALQKMLAEVEANANKR
jgi:imidazolonepropionase-like amidohydrolase